MIFADYQELVLEEYEQKKASGELSRRLIRLTAAKIKEECEVVCDRRYDRKDEKTLEEFFCRGGGDKLAWLKTIKASDPDDFKPLINFVRRKTRRPDEKVVELLAWLIDFKLRPYDFERKYPIVASDEPSIGKDEKATSSDEKVDGAGPPRLSRQSEKSGDRGSTGQRAFGLIRRKVGVLALVIAVVVGLIYWVWTRSSSPALTGHEGCMYWSSDHYEQIPCNQKINNALVVPLDTEKLAHFKRITKPDTITENALGSIWYAKVNDVYECYTAPGNHPIETAIQLKMLTDYVLIRHIRPRQGLERPVQ